MGKAGIRDTVADFLHEEALQRDGYARIAGIDEAGRGPWAGPVVAAAVVFEAGAIPGGLDDSKRLSAVRREELYTQIMTAGDVGVGIADAARIDSDNILNATLWAMAEATAALRTPCDHALIDGNRAPELSCPAKTLVGGDAISRRPMPTKRRL